VTVTHAVRLDVFEGPLDLLLHLVSKERLDVAEISISAITDEYLQTLKKMDEFDLETVSSFLLLAATLLELKSLKLLPGGYEDDPELAALLEERDHLIHRLIEYSTFKKVSTAISEGLTAGRGYFPRIADIPQEFLRVAPDLLEGVNVETLAQAASRLFAPRATPVVDVSFIAPIRVSVRETIDLLEEEIRTRKITSFRDLCNEVSHRIEVIVRFLALLELFRTESVDIEQSRPFDEIVVRWRQPRVGISE
jgi:segregation and condensation protein A